LRPNKLDENKVAVYLSKGLYDEVKKRVTKGTEFKSVEGYVEFVLRGVLKEEGEAETYTREDEELIKKRLRRLGYL
jgi:hypothetical protein